MKRFPDYPSSTSASAYASDSDEKIKTLNKSAIINRTRLYSCDKTTKLYTLSQSIRNRSNNNNNNRAQACDRYERSWFDFIFLVISNVSNAFPILDSRFFRPFVVMPIPYSNLILLVKDLNCPLDDMYYRMSVKAEEYKYTTSSCDAQPCLPCYKTTRTSYRRRPASCISQNKNVRVQATIFHSNSKSFHAIFVLALSRSLIFYNVDTGTQYQSAWFL